MKAGEPVALEVLAEVPRDAGSVTAFDFCLENRKIDLHDGAREVFDHPAQVVQLGTDSCGVTRAKGTITVTYDRPGTYFAAVRVKSNVHGDANDVFTQILNLDRVRIVVL